MFVNFSRLSSKRHQGPPSVIVVGHVRDVEHDTEQVQCGCLDGTESLLSCGLFSLRKAFITVRASITDSMGVSTVRTRT
jgi:hypothetical protein